MTQAGGPHRPAAEPGDTEIAAAVEDLSTVSGVGAAESLPTQRRAGLLAVTLLVAAGLFTLLGLLPAFVWAVVFAVTLWPQFDRLARRWPGHRRVTLPLAFTLCVLLAFVLPLTMLGVPLVHDAHGVAAWIEQTRQKGIPTPPILHGPPRHSR